ncbi:MAG: V-type ATP synthase subunit E [Lachnospiraceae bacterium]|nr:V-type ATP synthase subunit E [Lachnospiraceae bacterium]
MDGLNKLIDQIQNDASKSCSEIIDKAKAEEKEILAEAKKEADRIKNDSEIRKDALEKSGNLQAKSSSDLKKRQTILAAKQEIISDILDKAYESILNKDTDEYFSFLEKILKKHVQNKKGELLLSKKDLDRCPATFKDSVKTLAKEAGGELSVKDEAADIEGGFILVYGGIEENCSIKALFRENQNKLSDEVSAYLFRR